MPSWLVPLPDEIVGKALEADKMSPEVLAWHWKNVLDPIVQVMGPYIGKSFTHITIDSYEAGGQDWTDGYRERFR